MMSSMSSSVPIVLGKQKQYQEMYFDVYQNTSTNTNTNVKSSQLEPNVKPSRMSISHAKGLLNMPGQNNCFLNSAVQVLWHLDIFRRSFRELSGHACMADSCIFCALKELFNQFQYSQESALPPDALRFALAEAFSDQRRFQLGFMDDAAECFENILLRIHCHIANQDSEEMCNTTHCLSHCIPHQKFAMNLIEQIICHSCGATSEPFPFTQMVHYVSTPALCAQAKQYDYEIGLTFGELLKSAGAVGDIRDCPRSCGARIQIKKSLVNKPDIVSIGLVWDSERPTLTHIMNVFRAIGTTLRLPDVFDSVSECRPTVSPGLQLVGLVTYYGKHYSTFFFHTKLREWIYFDDAAVRPIGPHWQQVVDKCIRGHFQPLLLLYANPNGEPVSTENAPKDITPLVVKKKTTRRAYLSPLQAKCDTTPSANNYHSLQTPQRTAMPSTHMTPDSDKSNIRSVVQSVDKKNVSNVLRQLSGQNQMHKPIPPQQYTEQIYSNTTLVKPSLNTYMGNTKPRPNHINVLQHQSNAQSSSDVPDSPSGMSSVSYFSDVGELDNRYISRKTVESILSLQRHSLTKKAGNRNSSSSLESFDIRNGNLVFNKNHLLNEKPTICSLQRHDSGNSSGDRNSASSASVSSIETPFSFVTSKRRPFSNHPSSPKLSSDQGYDSFSLSSTDSYPSVTNSSTTCAKLHSSRLKQIPEDVQLMELINASTMLDCDKLCSAADVLLLKSHEKEREGDLRAAAALSDSAASKARSAMDAPYSNHQTLITAKMKHSMCVMRSASLHKRLNELEAEEKRKIKEQLDRTTGPVSNHSRQGSRDSTHSKHSRQGSKDSKEVKNKEMNSKHASLELNSKLRLSDGSLSAGKTLELYATLPKKGSKKKLLQQGLNSLASMRVKSDDSNLYKDVICIRDSVNSFAFDPMTHSLVNNNNNKKKVENNSKKCNESNKLVPNSNKSKVSVSGNKVKQTNSENLLKQSSRESDFSDYYSEWEGTRRAQEPLQRTLSGSASCRENDSEFYGEVGAYATQTIAKKQHRVRRKLLMGGFMKRKNRSLPDLREGVKDGSTNCPNEAPNELSEKETTNECKTIAQISAKGFHQSHRAFISERGLYQRPSLLKVNPPLIDKTDQTYDSVSNIYNNPKVSPSARIQTNSNHINNNQFSLNNQSTGPPTPPKAKTNTSIGSKPEVESNSKDKKCVENSFLKELAQKRAEIMKSSIKAEKCSEGTNGSNMQTSKELINHVIPQNSGTTVKSVLKNSLPNHNMNTESDSNYESINLKPRTPPHSLPLINQMPNSINKNISFQTMQTTSTSPKTAEQMDDSNQTITSVRDLTSKFEKIMNTKEVENSDEKLNESLEVNESNRTDKTDSLSNGSHRVVALMPNNKSEEINASKLVSDPNKSDIYSVHSPSTITAQTNISVNNCLTPAVRPNRPPDYQTAMKRIGMLRCDKSAQSTPQNRSFYMNASGNLVQGNCGPRSPQSLQIASQLNESQKSVSKPIVSELPKQQTLNTTNKCHNSEEHSSAIRKKIFKKSVSFSDQVTLVACAGEDQEEYMPNPILDRILGKNNPNFAPQSP